MVKVGIEENISLLKIFEIKLFRSAFSITGSNLFRKVTFLFFQK